MQIQFNSQVFDYLSFIIFNFPCLYQDHLQAEKHTKAVPPNLFHFTRRK